MTAQVWLKQAESLLNEAGIGTARLDCLVLVEDETSKERGWLLAHPEYELTAPQLKKLDTLIGRRVTHEPLAYLRNKTEFYGREFYIDHRVLEPRPESETMIELLKSLELLTTPTIIDIGTGSGMLAITTKLEFPRATVIATDIDQGCLDVALQNAKTYNTKVTFLKTSLLENLEDKTLGDSIILANLPYVPDSFQINPAAMAEPRIAIFGGSDGLELYRKLFSQSQALTQKPRFILTESMPPQHEELARIAQNAGFSLEKRDDFIQLFGSTV
jgi:release factor glutamine methyltransferase